MRGARSTSIFWTIQPARLLETIAASGMARPEQGEIRDVPDAYRWLAPRLRRRLPECRGSLPWWFYCRKPDLRRHRHAWVCGERLVRFEVELDSSRFVSFPSWAWHHVYCREYLALSLEEYRRWKAALRRAVPDVDTWPFPEPWKGRLERSWERLFTGIPERPWPGHRRAFGWSPGGCEAAWRWNAKRLSQKSLRRHEAEPVPALPSLAREGGCGASQGGPTAAYSENTLRVARPKRERHLPPTAAGVSSAIFTSWRLCSRPKPGWTFGIASNEMHLKFSGASD